MSENQTPAGASVTCLSLLATSIPCPRWMERRQPRINGDTRRRKRRLREKLAKRDAIKYGPAIREWAVDQKLRIEADFIQHVQATASPLFANNRIGHE